MDDIRSDKRYNYMKEWHYADAPKDKTEVADIVDADNAIFEIQCAMDELAGKNKLTYAQKNFDIKVLFHLIGDIHQPLHCGYKADRGGNDVSVEFNFQAANLHNTWDTKILEYKLEDVQKGVVEFCKKLTPAEKAKYQKIDLNTWFKDSRAYLPLVYDTKGDIQEEYMQKALPVIEKQLVIGGLRLAAVLNQVFAK
jgi:hypothetical protein